MSTEGRRHGGTGRIELGGVYGSRVRPVGGLTSAATRGAGAQVVSLATGTQCAGADRLQRDELTLHDSHAEALARRALVAALQADVHALRQVGEPLSLRDEVY
jgi:hypothetical protein